MLFFLTLLALGFTVVYRKMLGCCHPEVQCPSDRRISSYKRDSSPSRRLAQNNKGATLQALLIFALSALIFSLPTLYRFKFWVSSDAAQGGSTIAISASRSPEDRFTYSARPWHYLIPDINHPVFGNTALKIHKWIWSRPPYYLTERFFPKEHTLYLGFTLFLLSGYALFKVLQKSRNDLVKYGSRGACPASEEGDASHFAKATRDRCVAATGRLYLVGEEVLPAEHFYILLFAFLAVSMMICSFPPYVEIGGFRIHFPSHFLYRFFPQVRAYARFGSLVFICNAVVASFGLRLLLRRFFCHPETHLLSFRRRHPERNEVKRRISFLRHPEDPESSGDEGSHLQRDSSPPPTEGQNDGQSCACGRRGGYIVLSLIFSAVILEFLNFPPFHNISTRPPKAYQWLAEQEEDFAYLEYPTRIYYTDRLYQHIHGKEILNSYHRTTLEVKELVREIDSPEFVSRFEALGGRYILFHRPEEKSEKQRAAESWGFPAWGTHAKLPEPEEVKSESYFLDDSRFEEVYDFGDTVIFKVRVTEGY